MLDDVIVYKFGGTSVSRRENLETIAGLVADSPGRCLIAVSALGGITDLLVSLCEWSPGFLPDRLRRQHANLIAQCFPPESAVLVQNRIDQLLEELDGELAGNGDRGTTAEKDRILSFGERMSSEIVAAFIAFKTGRGVLADARRLVVTDDCFGEASPLRSASLERVRQYLEPMLEKHEVVVTQGFLGATRDGRTTTMGRGGSDITATFLADLLQAGEVQIWTDVDGILSADPRVIPDANLIQRLSHDDASLLAHFGAHVLHPRTIDHLLNHSIPLRIRNTFQPDHPATLIADGACSPAFVVTAAEVELFFRHRDGKRAFGVAWRPEWGVSLADNDPVAVILDEVVDLIDSSSPGFSLICVMCRNCVANDYLAALVAETEDVVASRSFSLDETLWQVLLVPERQRQALVVWFHERLNIRLQTGSPRGGTQQVGSSLP